jgi:hypothetical protein
VFFENNNGKIQYQKKAQSFAVDDAHGFGTLG